MIEMLNDLGKRIDSATDAADESALKLIVDECDSRLEIASGADRVLLYYFQANAYHGISLTKHDDDYAWSWRQTEIQRLMRNPGGQHMGWFYSHLGSMLVAGIALHAALIVFGAQHLWAYELVGPLAIVVRFTAFRRRTALPRRTSAGSTGSNTTIAGMPTTVGKIHGTPQAHRAAGQRAVRQNRNSRVNLTMNARFSSIGSRPGRSVVSRWSL